MPCPHPRSPIERHVGSHVSLVCPDCNTQMAPVAPEPEPEPVVEDAIVDDVDEAGHVL